MTQRVNSRNGGKPNTSRERQVIAEQRIEVEHLDIAGHTIRRITTRLNVSRGTVAADLDQIRKRRREEMTAGMEAERDREVPG